MVCCWFGRWCIQFKGFKFKVQTLYLRCWIYHCTWYHGLTRCWTLLEYKDWFIIYFSGNVHDRIDLPTHGLEHADDGANEMSWSHRFFSLWPPRTSSKLKLMRILFRFRRRLNQSWLGCWTLIKGVNKEIGPLLTEHWRILMRRFQAVFSVL